VKPKARKFEIRNPKQIQMTETNAMFQTRKVRIRCFGFSLVVSLFDCSFVLDFGAPVKTGKVL
jgi:hypothetical protein